MGDREEFASRLMHTIAGANECRNSSAYCRGGSWAKTSSPVSRLRSGRLDAAFKLDDPARHALELREKESRDFCGTPADCKAALKRLRSASQWVRSAMSGRTHDGGAGAPAASSTVW